MSYLLGRPNQYIGKINFIDKRFSKLGYDAITVEIFDNLANLNGRKKYVEGLGKVTPMGVQYQFINRNLLLRIDKTLTPAQAEEYEIILNTL